jgi:hypothetical protein
MTMDLLMIFRATSSNLLRLSGLLARHSPHHKEWKDPEIRMKQVIHSGRTAMRLTIYSL